MSVGCRDEAARLVAVETIKPLIEAHDATLAHLVHLAASSFGVPIAAIALLDHDRQSYVEKVGTDVCDMPRKGALCETTIRRRRPLVIPDAADDPRFSASPFVTHGPRTRFYAGVPIRFHDQPIGSFCLIDREPRHGFTAAERDKLHRFGAVVEEILAARWMRAGIASSGTRFERMADTLSDALIVVDEKGSLVFWNPGAERLFGHTDAEAKTMVLADLLPPADRYGPERFGDFFDAFAGRTREITILTRDRAPRLVEFSTTRWSENGRAFYGSVVRDISERKAMEARLHRLAHHDALTELPNRTVFLSRLEAALAAGSAGVMLIDLDGFKDVNDKVGHWAGDEVLKIAAQRLVGSVGLTDTVARLGGDEFLVLLPGCDREKDAAAVADRILVALARPFELQERTVNLGASIGIAMGAGDRVPPDELLSAADLALYRAKDDGRHCLRIYDPGMREKANRQRRFTQDIRRAVDRREFVLFYQPQFDLRDGRLIGAEALIRWRHPDHGLLAPGAFLETVEASRYAAEIGDWVVRSACRQAARWRAMGHPDFKMAVNVCASQVRAGTLALHTLAVLGETGLPARNLDLEITERIVLGGDERAPSILSALREAGVGIAFDDYGTGYASLSVLKNYPLTTLKIDRSFVREMDEAGDGAIVRAILQLAEGFGLRVVAEGIETMDQLAQLRAKGCVAGQGYLFSQPVPAETFEQEFIYARTAKVA